MKRAVLVCVICIALLLTGCYTQNDIEEARSEKYLEGYDKGLGEGYEYGYEAGYESGYENGKEDALCEIRDDYSFGYDIGRDEAAHKYAGKERRNETEVGQGFRDGWFDAIYEYGAEP